MKKFTAVLALLCTAILCLTFAACDRTPTGDDSTTTTLSPTTDYTEESEGTVYFTEEFSSTQAVTEQSTTATPKTTAPTTKPVTTAKPTTTAPPTTTVPPQTNPPAPTTTAPVTTTKPEPTTQEPSTTLPIITQTGTTEIITDGEDKDFELDVIELINKERVAAGLPALKVSNDLSSAADIRAEEIVKEFSHVRPDGTFCFTVSPIMSAENIAKGQSTPQSVVSAWMNSDGHRKNILAKQATITGVGCYYDSATDTYYWVQVFG